MILYTGQNNKEYHLIDFDDLHQQMLFRRYKGEVKTIMKIFYLRVS